MEIQLNMLGVMVSDMPAALRFYPLLGLDIPAAEDEKPFVLHRMGSGVTLFFDTMFAKRYDPHYQAPLAGYRTLVEFYLGEDVAVDARYGLLTDAGYHGRMMPQQTIGPYAGMVDDPDGNVILLPRTTRSGSTPAARRRLGSGGERREGSVCGMLQRYWEDARHGGWCAALGEGSGSIPAARRGLFAAGRSGHDVARRQRGTQTGI